MSKLDFILTNFAKHAAIHGKAYLFDVIFWNSHAFLPCGAEKIEHCSIVYPRGKSHARVPRIWKLYMDLKKAG